jgi:feruloyl esterase
VQRLLGPDRTDGFLRLFVAPGVGHCGGGVGPQPTGAFEALVDWVEHGRAPEQLLARQVDDATGEVVATRPLFRYPRVARWTGTGDPADAGSYAPAEGTRLQLPPGR